LNGRSDKKFCDDGCRNTYHNNRMFNKTVSIKQVNAILRNNRRILQVFMPQKGKIQIPKQTLLTKGFDFNYITSMAVKNKRTVLYCYDIGYSLAEDGSCEMSKYDFK
jgi:hypothetical protein